MKQNSSNLLKTLVNYYLLDVGSNKDDLAFKLDISRSSLYDKLNNPDKFTFGEFKLLAKVIHLTPEQIVRVTNI